jgi:NADPH-dependent glutamate synthase beta subunit-like oxidoreductase
MSTGGTSVIVEAGESRLEGTLQTGGGVAGRLRKAPEKVLGKTLKKKILPPDAVVAVIDPSKCINCGTCRENCPAQAITENQRTICRVCPTCTELPGISVGKMKALPTETSCTTKCPLGISPQGYLGLTKAGKFEEAYQLIWNKNPLLSVCARVCHHPCELGCKRGILVDEPIKIREVKRYLSEKVNYNPAKYVRMWEEQIAIIGAGPAGLTAGHYLAKAGYDVTIFEADEEAGGMLIRGIPEFRLNREVVREEIAKLVDAGLKIKLNQKLNQYSVDELKSEYDAIIVAAGTPNSRELFIDGWRNAGIMTALNFMEHVNNKQLLRRHLGQLFKFDGGKAVIIGGGSVAIDCARTAVRTGAAKVTVVCLEEGDAVPAHDWEVKEAIDEGIEFIEGYSPVQFTAKLYPTLTGVKFEKVTSIGKDADGAFKITTDQSNTINVECDWCVEAIGQGRDAFWNSVKEDGVFFAGDISSNACSVIDAMASGRKTALDVDAALRGRALRDPLAEQNERLTAAPVEEKLFPYNFRKILRPKTPLLPADERIHNFADVEGVFTDEEAYRESDCCLGCGYEVVDFEKCLGCGICLKLCPKGNVISMIANPDKEEAK